MSQNVTEFAPNQLQRRGFARVRRYSALDVLPSTACPDRPACPRAGRCACGPPGLIGPWQTEQIFADREARYSDHLHTALRERTEGLCKPLACKLRNLSSSCLRAGV